MKRSTEPLFLRVTPQALKRFEALARRAKLGKARMFERLVAESK